MGVSVKKTEAQHARTHPDMQGHFAQTRTHIHTNTRIHILSITLSEYIIYTKRYSVNTYSAKRAHTHACVFKVCVCERVGLYKKTDLEERKEETFCFFDFFS